MNTSTACPRTEVEFIYNTQESDKETALNKAVSYGLEKGWELVAVVWDSQEKGKHIFKILYNA
jgi:hypothetical protein